MVIAKLAAAAVGLSALVPTVASAAPHWGRWGHHQPRAVERWVPGYMTTNFVPGMCRYSRWRGQVCEPGRSVRQWVPGHYETFSRPWVASGPTIGFGIHIGG